MPIETEGSEGIGGARPRCRPGIRVHDVGLGEVAVWMPDTGQCAVVPAAASGLLPLLDGTRTLDDVSARMARLTPTARPGLLLAALVQLHASGMLEHSDDRLPRFLEEQRKSTDSWQRRLLIKLAFVRLMASWSTAIRWTSTAPGITASLYGSAVVLAAYVVMGLWLAIGARQSMGPALLTNAPAPGMLIAMLGASLAASARALGVAAALRLLGRSFNSAGLGISAGIPHLVVDARQYLLLDRRGRMALGAAGLASAAVVPLALSLFWATGAPGWVGALAVGAHLAFLADLSPLWPSDASLFLQESLRTRHLHRRSYRYLLRKLWIDALSRRHLDEGDTAMLATASLAIAWLFVFLLTMASVAPMALQSASNAVLHSKIPMLLRGATILAAAYVIVATCVTVLALAAALAGAFWRLASVGARRQAPATSIQVPALSLDQLVAEVASIPPFHLLPTELVKATLAGGRIETYNHGQVIIRQNDHGDTCYIIRKGTCDIIVEDPSGGEHHVATRQPGDLFGEAALLHDKPRTASVIARSSAELLVLEKRAFMQAVVSSGSDQYTLARALQTHLFLKHHPLFQGLPAARMSEILASVTIRAVLPEEVLISEGDVGHSMFLISSGQMSVSRSDQGWVATLGPGEYFGEIALVTGTARTATVSADTEGVLVELPADVFRSALASRFHAGLVIDQQADKRLERLSLV